MIRPATVNDVLTILEILDVYAGRGLLLPRSRNDIYENLRDFLICENDSQTILGVGALHVCWEDLGEIRSLAVREEFSRRGCGRQLVNECEKEALRLGLRRVFTLTYQEAFFNRLGYRQIDKNQLPHKIWGDCLKCVKFPDCDEIAMLKQL
jgi:amino-acid N-acetyltransferase